MRSGDHQYLFGVTCCQRQISFVCSVPFSPKYGLRRKFMDLATKISRISFFGIRRQQKDLPNAAFLP